MAKSLTPHKTIRPTIGYPSVETLIDSENFDDMNAAFVAAYDELGALVSKKRGLKKGRDAKKAMEALELTMELFRELLALKYKMIEEQSRQKQKGVK